MIKDDLTKSQYELLKHLGFQFAKEPRVLANGRLWPAKIKAPFNYNLTRKARASIRGRWAPPTLAAQGDRSQAVPVAFYESPRTHDKFVVYRYSYQDNPVFGAPTKRRGITIQFDGMYQDWGEAAAWEVNDGPYHLNICQEPDEFFEDEHLMKIFREDKLVKRAGGKYGDILEI